MGFRSFYKSMLKANYNFGRRASDMITSDMPYKKAKTVGTTVDIAASAGLTYLSILPMIGWVSAAASAVSAAIVAPIAIPSALGVVASAALSVGLGSFTVPLVAGFLSSAMDKLNIPKPSAAVTKAKNAVRQTTQTVTKPFKWVGNKLSHAFKKAHDGKTKTPKFSPKNASSKPGHYQL